MGNTLKETRSGFTIIEVMLFLALSGFMLLGIFLGTGSSIANQRYKDAVQDAADALRKAYSFVSDTQIEERDKDLSSCSYLTNEEKASSEAESESGRGRTSCAVYGAVVVIDRDTIQTTTLIGKDYYDLLQGKANADNIAINDPNKTDKEILYELKANNLAKQCDASGTTCQTVVAGNSATQKLRWEANFKKPNGPDGTSNNDLALTLLIYRSPRDGGIHTLSMDDVIRDYQGQKVDYRNIRNDANIDEYGVNKMLRENDFQQKDVFFCIDSGGAGSYAEHNRIVHIVKDAQSQSGIIMEDLDADVKDSNGNTVSCDRI